MNCMLIALFSKELSARLAFLLKSIKRLAVFLPYCVGCAVGARAEDAGEVVA